MKAHWRAWWFMALLPAGCARQTPMDYLHGAAGPAARPIEALTRGFLGITTAVVVIVAVLLCVAIVHARRAARDEGDVVRRGAGGLGWIYWGVGLSVPVLVGMTLWSMLVVRAVANPAADRRTVDVEVVGHRWWWEIRYLAEQPAEIFTSANELVVPVGVPVRLRLTSMDVIHDFWMPKLGPKMDMIPGQWNATWLQADRPGVYVGQCAEYCGIAHAKMGLRVVALPPERYAAWRAHARGVAHVSASHGRRVFEEVCASCHAVRGTPAGGIVGPDLTHFASRLTLAAGMLPNTPANRMLWLAHTQQVKPGAQMPQIPLQEADRAAVVAYLGSLR